MDTGITQLQSMPSLLFADKIQALLVVIRPPNDHLSHGLALGASS